MHIELAVRCPSCGKTYPLKPYLFRAKTNAGLTCGCAENGPGLIPGYCRREYAESLLQPRASRPVPVFWLELSLNLSGHN